MSDATCPQWCGSKHIVSSPQNVHRLTIINTDTLRVQLLEFLGHSSVAITTQILRQFSGLAREVELPLSDVKRLISALNAAMDAHEGHWTLGVADQ